MKTPSWFAIGIGVGVLLLAAVLLQTLLGDASAPAGSQPPQAAAVAAPEPAQEVEAPAAEARVEPVAPRPSLPPLSAAPGPAVIKGPDGRPIND
ncbi:MAG: hypothetical protein HY002_03895 [Candidatus Rokubacteria bacterium]|nr:hypothetical protein [Candidatus Rokubacteria bacterium]